MSSVTIYSLEVFLSQFGTSPLFPFLPIWFKLLLLDLHKVSQEAGKEVFSSHLLKNFPDCCDPHSQWIRSRCFLEFSCFFSHPTDVGNVISGSSSFSKSSLNIWKFLVHVLLKPSLENFEHYFASMWNECNCVVVWTFFGTDFLWDWNKNSPLPVLWPLVSFPNLFILSAALSQHHLLGCEKDHLDFHHLC